ncbi:hypothetical protein OSTOST_12942 [Ostertagia ostertagi]
MELWCPYYMMGPHHHFGGVDRLERALNSYWRDADHSVMHVANETQQVSLRQVSFVRSWTLPENVDLDAVRTQLNDAGHLSIEAPKVTETSNQRRAIPIERAPSNKH